VAVQIEPDGNTVLITGKNGAGKSCVLDAITAALCGKKAVPEKPIREGQESAEVVVETENYVIKRTFTAKGGSLTVTNSDGFNAKSPQSLLDKIVGEIAFEPMSFIDYEGRKQRQVLMGLVGLDYSDLDEQMASLRLGRSMAGHDRDGARHQAGAIEVADDVPDEEVSIKHLTDSLENASRHNNEQITLRNNIENVNREMDIKTSQINEGLERIAKLREQIAEETTKIDRVGQRRSNQEKEKAKMAERLEPVIDEATIRAEMEKAGEINAKVQQKRRRAELLAAADKARQEFAALGKKMGLVDAEKAKRLSNTKMPVEGLSVGDTGLLYKGIPLAQVNSAKQLEIAVAISMALNPTLRVIRMDGNNLDHDTLAVISKMVKDSDYQVWVEKVEEDSSVGLYIEDGSIKNQAH